MTREEAIYQLMGLMPSKEKIVNSWTKEHFEALSMAVRALEGNPWHKASEELPEESGSYLVKYTIDSCSVPYDGICHYYECRWINAHLLGNGRIHITHWMPIPELPKED